MLLYQYFKTNIIVLIVKVNCYYVGSLVKRSGSNIIDTEYNDMQTDRKGMDVA